MRRQVKPARNEKESPLQSVRVGFNFVRDNSVILALMSMDTCVQFFGAYRSMMPAFARDILGVGPTGLGALLGVPALGALAGSGLILGLGNPKRKGQLIITVTLLYTIGLICFALSRSLALSLVIVFCLGLVGRDRRDFARHLGTANHAGPHARPGKKLRSGFHVRGNLLGHAQIGTAATFIGVPGALILGGCIGSAAVLIVAKFARSLRTLNV